MVTELGPVYGAIADPTRRAILDALLERERSAGEIASLFPVSRPAVSKHLAVLRRAGLVKERKAAQARIYSLEPQPLFAIEKWLTTYRVFWAVKLQNLKSFVESQPDAPEPRKEGP